MYSGFHAPEGQGSALREVEWQDSSCSSDQESQLRTFSKIDIQELESQQHTFSKIDIQELESLLRTPLDFNCSFQEEKEKQLSHCDAIGYDEPPKPKGKSSRKAKNRTEKTLGLQFASSYSSTHDYQFPKQQFQLDHGFRVSLHEPHLPCQLSEPLSSLGLSSVSGTSRFREPGTSRFRESGTSRSRESGVSLHEPHLPCQLSESLSSLGLSSVSGASRFRKSGTSRFREPGTSRFHESGTSRFHESGTSRESNPEQQRKHERTKEVIKVTIKHNAAMEAPYIVEALVKSVQSSYNKGQLDMTEAKEQLLSSGKSLLYAVTQAYCKSESSPEVIRKISLALDKCSLSHLLPRQLQLLANIISFHDVKRVIEILKYMFDGKIGRVDGCTQIFDILGRSACRYYGSSIGGLAGGIAGGAVGGPGGALVGAGVGTWAGEKLGSSLWDLIKEAISYIINYIWSLLK